MAGEASLTTLTPSGIEIAYYPPPDRHYEINSVTVPGVTEVLDVLDKKALVWWGMKVGVQGSQELLGKGYAIGRMSPEEVEQALIRNKLTVNHVRDKAGDRGKAVHDAFEDWAKTGAIPDPDMFPESEKGYVQGLVQFLTDTNAEAQDSEVICGSVEHGFAGRYDCRLKIPRSCEVVYKITPKRTFRATLKPGLILSDLKTSAHVYPTHHLQIEAYEGASIECGYGPTQHRGILHVTKDGRYEFVRSVGSYQGFLAVKAVYDELKRMKGK